MSTSTTTPSTGTANAGIIDCGCPSTCTAEALQETNEIGTWKCLDRIQYIMAKYNEPQINACWYASQWTTSSDMVYNETQQRQPPCRYEACHPIGCGSSLLLNEETQSMLPTLPSAQPQNDNSNNNNIHVDDMIIDCGCPYSCTSEILNQRNPLVPWTCHDRIQQMMIHHHIIEQYTACIAGAELDACNFEACHPEVCGSDLITNMTSILLSNNNNNNNNNNNGASSSDTNYNDNIYDGRQPIGNGHGGAGGRGEDDGLSPPSQPQSGDETNLTSPPQQTKQQKTTKDPMKPVLIVFIVLVIIVIIFSILLYRMIVSIKKSRNRNRNNIDNNDNDNDNNENNTTRKKNTNRKKKTKKKQQRRLLADGIFRDKQKQKQRQQKQRELRLQQRRQIHQQFLDLQNNNTNNTNNNHDLENPNGIITIGGVRGGNNNISTMEDYMEDNIAPSASLEEEEEDIANVNDNDSFQHRMNAQII